MTYINKFCADVGTENCPCPLAETGDCLICSRLAGRGECDCRWSGVCIYNEYIQNNRIIRNRRENEPIPVLKKIWYRDDLLVLVLEVTRGFALKAAQPGAFVFLNSKGKSEFCNVPVSVMKADVEKCRLYLALKIISGKTKIIAEQKSSLVVRGVYRNGLLGKGMASLAEDAGIKDIAEPAKDAADRRLPSLHEKDLKKWLIITKGVGFAPAVNLLRWADGRVQAELLTDVAKVGEEVVRDYLHGGADRVFEKVKVRSVSLQEMIDAKNNGNSKGCGRLAGKYLQADYDRVIILASDYYIKTLTSQMDIPADKLVFSNNFRMCCGEGICGACGHIDAAGNVSRMCKCKELSIEELCFWENTQKNICNLWKHTKKY